MQNTFNNYSTVEQIIHAIPPANNIEVSARYHRVSELRANSGKPRRKVHGSKGKNLRSPDRKRADNVNKFTHDRRAAEDNDSLAALFV